MGKIIALLSICLGLCLTGRAAPHTKADLVLDKEAAKAGETVLAGVRLRMDPKWHTYWRNPGASGMATKIKWVLPEGFVAGAIQWPTPEKLPAQDLTTYVYHHETVLLVPIMVPEKAQGEVTLKATVSWLECETQCIPGKAEVSASLKVADESRSSPDSPRLQEWLQRVPEPGQHLKVSAWWDGPANGNKRPLAIEFQALPELSNPDFYPDGSLKFEVAGETEVLESDAEVVRLRKNVLKLSAWPGELSGIVVGARGSERQAYEVSFPVKESRKAAPSGRDEAATSSTTTGRAGLLQMILYAFIGGLILNIMPCVLPVIALKILGFVAQANDQPRVIKKLGLMYALGVWVSFAALAAMVIGLKVAGRNAGWGMQFGNPQFLVLLTILIALVAFNLFGLFEVNLGGSVMEKAGTITARGGAGGAFLNGVLATVLATPCTAPFLRAALGFAFVASPGVILIIFSTVALGLAAPYLVLSWNPGWLKVLPRPGAWMERFKVAMGFPMLATAAWLLGLTQIHYGRKSFWLALFLVGLGMAAWIYGQFVQRLPRRRFAGMAAAIVILVTGYGFALESQMQWRKPQRQPEAQALVSNTNGIPWEKWSREAVATARAAGRPVLVDFTADWCLTCQANKKFAIEIPSVRARLKEINAVPLMGDYTLLPGEITEELRRFGRAGVPLVLVYPKNVNAPPIVLPEALTPGLVLDALSQAAR